MKITLKGGEIREFENGISVADIAKEISMGLFRNACSCRINGEVKDLRTVVDEDCTLEILTLMMRMVSVPLIIQHPILWRRL